MGRPRKETKQLVVEIDGNYLVWSDGHLSGNNPEIIKEAQYLSHYEIDIELTPLGPTIKANVTDAEHPEQALAAMMGAGKGRARLLEAPQEVIDLLPFD
jgi:hypothetical protein